MPDPDPLPPELIAEHRAKRAAALAESRRIVMEARALRAAARAESRRIVFEARALRAAAEAERTAKQEETA